MNCAGVHRALHAAFTVSAGAPRGISAWVGCKQQGPTRSRVIAHRYSINMDVRFDSNDDPIRTALLISGPETSSAIRGEGITNLLSSWGFDVREVGPAKEEENSAIVSHEALLKLTVPSASSSMVFDLGGRGGAALALACKEAGVAGLYAFRPATGMFQKVCTSV